MKYDQADEEKEIAEQLVKIRRRRKLKWLFTALLILVFYILVWRRRWDYEFVTFLYIIPFFIPTAIYHFVTDYCRCPRCLDYFHGSGLRYNPFARKCLHCGLALYADKK
jgi:hypothetical protein